MNEKKIAASNYIINFYQEIQALKQQYAVYRDLLLEIEQSQNKDLDNLEDNVKETIKNQAKQLRYCTILAMTSYKGIATATKKETNQKIQDSYNEIVKNFIIKIKDIEQFVENINQYLLDDIITNLLKTSEDLINEIYPEQ